MNISVKIIAKGSMLTKVILLLFLLFSLTLMQQQKRPQARFTLEMDRLRGFAYSSPDGKRLRKDRHQTIESIYSYEPMPDNKVITINVKILTSSSLDMALGFASEAGKTSQLNYPGGNTQSFGWHFLRNWGRVLGAKPLPYGKALFVGDVITLRLDLTTAAGSLTYSVSGQNMGIAFIGVKRLAPLYFGIYMYNLNDVVEIQNAKVSDC